jgi:hypothetical protein
MTILEALKISKIIRRKSWNNNEYLEIAHNGQPYYCGASLWSTHIASLTADDWIALLPLPKRHNVIVTIRGVEYEGIETPFVLPNELGKSC